MVTPGQPSGTTAFNLSNADVVFEAFDRIRVRPTAITRHHIMSARNSINLELIDWNVKNGPNLWKIVGPTTINLVTGQLVYTLPTNLVAITELWYSTVNGNGAGINNDRIMVPITRTQYAMLPNKGQQGIPTQFWFQPLGPANPPQFTIWETAQAGAPNYVLNYFGLQRIQDANVGSGETPDVTFRGLEALCAGVAKRLKTKFMDPALFPVLGPIIDEDARVAWENFAAQDQENGPMLMQPNVGAYGRIG